MATTSLSLGEHWENFIKNAIASGRYGSASEVVCDALRGLEEREKKLKILREYLAREETQSAKGETIQHYPNQHIIDDLENEE
ncbi:MAG: type II toxin-antitoxin system ParD family antitoxin [Gammaproteobacteria bacterium]